MMAAFVKVWGGRHKPGKAKDYALIMKESPAKNSLKEPVKKQAAGYKNVKTQREKYRGIVYINAIDERYRFNTGM